MLNPQQVVAGRGRGGKVGGLAGKVEARDHLGACRVRHPDVAGRGAAVAVRAGGHHLDVHAPVCRLGEGVHVDIGGIREGAADQPAAIVERDGDRAGRVVAGLRLNGDARVAIVHGAHLEGVGEVRSARGGLAGPI